MTIVSMQRTFNGKVFFCKNYLKLFIKLRASCNRSCLWVVCVCVGGCVGLLSR